MNTEKITYNTKYLSSQVVDYCYQVGKHILVDKVVTGNGFTTASLNLPTIQGKTDLIIVPNKKVVASKQASYNPNGNKKIGFVYGDSTDTLDFEQYDVVMIVIDSFLLLLPKITKNIDKVGRVLSDEVHSTIIQSIFREKLVGFSELLEETFPNKAVVSVTATPMLFQKPDIQLVPYQVEKRTINVSYQQKNTIKRLKERLDNNEKCIVALQDARILKHLLQDGKLIANFKTGVTLFESILEVAEVVEDESSNLVIISSAGFEGFDLEDAKYNVFIFEDRAFDFQTFFTENVYQVLGRARKGTLYIEWNRISNRNRKEIVSLDLVKKKAASTKISNEKKLTDKNYPYLRKYCTKVIDDASTGIITSLKVNETLYNLDKELHEADTKGLCIYDEFFNDRGIEINLLNDGDSRINKSNLSHKTKHKNVLKNRDIVVKGGYFLEPKLDFSPKQAKTYESVLNQYTKAYKKYLRRKYWNAPYLAWDERVTHDDVADSIVFERELKCLNTLQDEKVINKMIKAITKARKSQKRDELGKDSKEYKEFCEDVEEKTADILPRLLMALSQGKINIPKKTRNGRDFNILTECSMYLIKLVAEFFSIQVTESDIISCNLRILYAINGLSLPNNIYGENKKYKKNINKLLNKISKHHAIKQKTSVEDWKTNRKADLRKYNIDEKVIKYLIDNHFDNYKDSVYNLCINHEEKIINKLMSRFININNAGDYDVRFIRRHDSIISFGWWQESFDKALEQFEYEDIKGWFVQVDEVAKSSEEVAKDEYILRVYDMLGNFNYNMKIIENKWLEREKLNLEQERLKIEKERLRKLYLQNGKQIEMYKEAS